MVDGFNPKLRFGMSLQEATEGFHPGITDGPPLPVVNYALVGRQAPVVQPTEVGRLPEASAVVISWTEAEWAALQHVFCAGGTAMPYSDRLKATWPGWNQYSGNLPTGGPSKWTYWGDYQLMQVNGNPVLLFHSNTHLDWPGAAFLKAMITMLVANVKPDVILSVGTAGGAKTQDHIGTVRAVGAATLYQSTQPQASWPNYKNAWKASDAILGNAQFQQLLFPVPTQMTDLQALCAQFNQYYGMSYTLTQLDPNGLNLADAIPQIDDQTGGSASQLTSPTFLVGTTAGSYQAFTSIEMDDAIVGEACTSTGTTFAFVRNLSDPVQNAQLPVKIQGNWGGAIYDAYGFYTSYNGALAAWAMLP
jgi:hypothetical protein